MYKKILTPLDGSEFSECSLAHLKAIAKGCQVPEVVLFSVVEPVPHEGAIAAELGDDWFQNAEKGATEHMGKYLAEVAENLKNEGIAASTALAKGMPAEEILHYADKNQVDLIIISTHGRSGIVRWAMGGVADRVVRHSKAPVLIASPHACRIDV
jgi:nucleotide-binding universal stress UspA family protein